MALAATAATSSEPLHDAPDAGVPVSMRAASTAGAHSAVAATGPVRVAGLPAADRSRSGTSAAQLPTSAEFVSLASDPRGGDNAYNTFKRLPDGRGITFGGFSHDRRTDNSVMTYQPSTNRWSTLVANTPWVDGPPIAPKGMDVKGRAYLGNRDNHNTLVVPLRNEFWVTSGQRGGDLVGNWYGVLDYRNGSWTISDDAATISPVVPAPPHHINSAVGWIDFLGVGYLFGGARGDNPTDALVRIEVNPQGPLPFRQREWFNQWGSPSFPGAEKLRYVSNSHFVRDGKVQIYGGGHEMRDGKREAGHTLYELDVTAPRMRVVSVNTLADSQRVQGEAIFAYHIPARDLLVATDGRRVNVYDYATNAWADVRVTTPDDPERTDYGAGFYAPEVDMGIVLYRHAHLYGLRLHNGSARKTSPQPTAAIPAALAAAFVPVAGGSAPARSSEPLKVKVTAVPYVGPAMVLGSSKHLDFARLGDRWYKLAGDHAGIDPNSPVPQGGRQEILSFNVQRNDWRVDQPFYIKDPKAVQLALPDDAFAITRGDEAWVFVSARAGTAVQPPAAAVQDTSDVMAWKPGRGWRKVMPTPGEIGGNRAWRGIYDPVKDRFVIPANTGSLVWVVIGGDGRDMTRRAPGGAALQYGDRAFQVAGLAGDLDKRTAYAYDHLHSQLWSVNLDTLETRKVIDVPEPAASNEAAIKLVWHPDLRAVVIAASKLHTYRVDTGELTSWPRPDGFQSATGKHVPSSTLFFDPDTRDIVSIGSIDWDDGKNPGVYWRIRIE